MQDLTTYKQTSQNALQTTKDVEVATHHLSELNTALDQITADKELLTKPLNQSLKAIRDKYRPIETEITTLIAKYRTLLTDYATQEEETKQKAEQKILDNKKTSLDTKIDRLAELDNTSLGSKVSTTAGSITFTTITKYTLIDPAHTPIQLLELNQTKLKDYLKQGNPLPTGIRATEEKSLRNYRG